MGITENYGDNEEHIRTNPLLPRKLDKAGVVFKEDLEVLAKPIGIGRLSGKLPERSTPPLTDAKTRQRSVLGSSRYKLGHRLY